MERTLEPELMDDPEQALAYARADFAVENQTFVELFRTRFPNFGGGRVVDLGCGPADIPIRLVRALPDCRVTAIDGSPAMIRLGEEAVRAAGLAQRIVLRCRRLQDLELDEPADGVVSNSLLHHMPIPLQFWEGIKRCVKPGGAVLVMDLSRPASEADAEAIVERYAEGAPPILRRDFYRSLLAAFTEDEVRKQLADAELGGLTVERVDDRHWIAAGTVAGHRRGC